MKRSDVRESLKSFISYKIQQSNGRENVAGGFVVRRWFLRSAGLIAVFLCQLGQLPDAIRPPLQHRQMVARELRAHAAEGDGVLLAAGIGRAYSGASPFLAMATGFQAAVAKAVGFLFAALAAFAAGGEAAEINLSAHLLASMRLKNAFA